MSASAIFSVLASKIHSKSSRFLQNLATDPMFARLPVGYSLVYAKFHYLREYNEMAYGEMEMAKWNGKWKWQKACQACGVFHQSGWSSQRHYQWVLDKVQFIICFSISVTFANKMAKACQACGVSHQSGWSSQRHYQWSGFHSSWKYKHSGRSVLPPTRRTWVRYQN